MKTRFLHIILGIVLSFFTMQTGMAQVAIQEEARADVSQAGAVEKDSHKQKTFSLDDFGLLPELLSAEQAEFSYNGEEEETSNHSKRFSKYGTSLKHHFSSSFFANRATKGVAKHPRTQDPLQQRTETIRFLQKAALI